MSETELWEISNSDLEFKKEHNKDTLSKDDESYLDSDKEFNEDFIVFNKNSADFNDKSEHSDKKGN